ncbi:phytoene/squalene synthase family protein [Aeromicrobium yanjiei]|uniref:phytoene/squalene synthase family protein n=1 Tax=Aeromicrobium yanjiei TaxID=2662028 RepID=UPI001ABB51BB|nr:phytoene/squalene synthase family protein [Aeromicrobium yanjiei]
MSARELDAAGIHDPSLRSSYETCRRLNAEHGKSYYLATLLLPPHKRPHVHALYGFARYADDFVDSLTAPDPDRLVAWGDAFLDAVRTGGSDDPVAAAAGHTMSRYRIPVAYVEAFLQSMRQDITVSSYATYDDLRDYMYGSAAVIGLQMVPVLGVVDDRAHHHAQLLGEAFQLTNFIRDVGEDLVRGRVYLPQEDLDAFGVQPHDLRPGPVRPEVRDLVQFEVERARRLYAEAAPGIDLLDPTSRDCVWTAFHLYGGILDEVERAGHDVLNQRVTVSRPRRLRIAGPRLVAAARARRRVRPAHHDGPTTSTSTSTT